MTKPEIITAVALLPEDSPLLARLAGVLRGEDNYTPAPPSMLLIEVAKAVHKTPARLHQLNVPMECGVYQGGRRAYQLDRVVAYLQSDRCRQRVAELHALRLAREKSRNKNAQCE